MIERLPVLLIALLLVTSPATAARRQAPADERLDKKITLRLKKSPLSDVMAALQRETGLAFRASPAVADEPVVVYAFDQPAAEVMRQIARLFNYRWLRSGSEDRPRYELVQLRDAREAEESLRARDRLEALNSLRKNLGKPGGTDPRDSVVARLAASIQPAQWEALLAGERLYHVADGAKGVHRLPPGMAAELIEYLRPRARPDAPPEVQSYTARELERYEKLLSLKPVMRASLRLQLYRPSSDTVHLDLGLSTKASLPRESAANLPYYGSSYSARGTHRIPAPEPPDSEAEKARWGRDPLLGRRASFKVDRTAVLPPGRRRLKTEKIRLWDILPLVAETYRVNVVADAYHAQRVPPAPPEASTDLPLYELLNRHALPAASWRKEGSFLHLRSHTWHWDRLPEVPMRIVRHWAPVLRRQRWLTLDDAARLAVEMSDDQLAQFGSRLEGEGIHSGVYAAGHTFDPEDVSSGALSMLRVYAALTPRQKQALHGGGSLPFGTVEASARQRLHLLLESGRWPIGLEPGRPAGGELSLLSETQKREVVSSDERTTRVTVRRLDGLHAGKEPSLRTDATASLPPGAGRGGEIIQLVRFHLRDSSDAEATRTVYLTLPYFFIDPEVPAAPP